MFYMPYQFDITITSYPPEHRLVGECWYNERMFAEISIDNDSKLPIITKYFDLPRVASKNEELVIKITVNRLIELLFGST